MLAVYTNYANRMEVIADDIENDFNRADCRNEIDCAFEEAIDGLQSIYWQACDDGRIRKKELAKLENLRHWCCRDVQNAYDSYIWNLENDPFAPDSYYDI